MKLTVEMFGLSPFTEANSVDVEVQEEASISHLLEAMARKMPSLVGRVIQPGGKLVENYGLYVNSEFITDDHNIRFKKSDRVVLILLATGG